MLGGDDGRTLYIREATLEEAPDMARYIQRVMQAENDFYDVVGARERLLSQQRARLGYVRRQHAGPWEHLPHQRVVSIGHEQPRATRRRRKPTTN